MKIKYEIKRIYYRLFRKKLSLDNIAMEFLWLLKMELRIRDITAARRILREPEHIQQKFICWSGQECYERYWSIEDFSQRILAPIAHAIAVAITNECRMKNYTHLTFFGPTGLESFGTEEITVMNGDYMTVMIKRRPDPDARLLRLIFFVNYDYVGVSEVKDDE